MNTSCSLFPVPCSLASTSQFTTQIGLLYPKNAQNLSNSTANLTKDIDFIQQILGK